MTSFLTTQEDFNVISIINVALKQRRGAPEQAAAQAVLAGDICCPWHGDVLGNCCCRDILGILQPSTDPAHPIPAAACDSEPAWLGHPRQDQHGTPGRVCGVCSQSPKGDLGAALMEQKWGCPGVADPWEGRALSHRVALSLLGFGHSN